VLHEVSDHLLLFSSFSSFRVGEEDEGRQTLGKKKVLRARLKVKKGIRLSGAYTNGN
jgi:hypothetical protein